MPFCQSHAIWLQCTDTSHDVTETHPVFLRFSLLNTDTKGLHSFAIAVKPFCDLIITGYNYISTFFVSVRLMFAITNPFSFLAFFK